MTDAERPSASGRQLHGGRHQPTRPLPASCSFTVGSLFPLVWTAIAASRDQHAARRRPRRRFWFGGNLFDNLEIAWTDANMGDGPAQHD